jgi:hypothetical protein
MEEMKKSLTSNVGRNTGQNRFVNEGGNFEGEEREFDLNKSSDH